MKNLGTPKRINCSTSWNTLTVVFSREGSHTHGHTWLHNMWLYNWTVVTDQVSSKYLLLVCSILTIYTRETKPQTSSDGKMRAPGLLDCTINSCAVYNHGTETGCIVWAAFIVGMEDFLERITPALETFSAVIHRLILMKIWVVSFLVY